MPLKELGTQRVGDMDELGSEIDAIRVVNSGHGAGEDHKPSPDRGSW